MTIRADIAADIAREITRARELHGQSVERADNGLRLAILTEEVGEVARALCDLHAAEVARDNASRTGTTTDLEVARRNVEDARAHVFVELVQVAATAARWIEARG